MVKFVQAVLVWWLEIQRVHTKDGPWPDPSILLTRSKVEGWPVFDSGTFWPDLQRFYLTRSEKLGFLGEIFQTQTQTKDGWPNLTWHGSKFFDPDPSLVHTLTMLAKSLMKRKLWQFKKPATQFRQALSKSLNWRKTTKVFYGHWHKIPFLRVLFMIP